MIINPSFREKLLAGFRKNSSSQGDILCNRNIKNNFDFEGKKIGKGTYGHVYKAQPLSSDRSDFYAIKLIDAVGLTISACREISVLRELNHPNIIKLHSVYLNYEEKKVWIVLEYAEYDLWHMIRFQKEALKDKQVIQLPPAFVKSIMYQLIRGIDFLHKNWIMHRDLKPANILVMGKGPQVGRLKITDMGFARVFHNPQKPLADVDTVVVTLWYRAPELLLGTRHYTVAIDNWAIGCIFCELITYEPIFYCRLDDSKSNSSYNVDQLDKIFSIIGYPNDREWPTLKSMPDYNSFIKDFHKVKYMSCHMNNYFAKYMPSLHQSALNIIASFLKYDPLERLKSGDALQYTWFKDHPKHSANIFESNEMVFPVRKYMKDDIPPNTNATTG
ncbi:MAG: cyclin-dependent protein serine/threonine kinase 19, partial [Marteilia pararefringens]